MASDGKPRSWAEDVNSYRAQVGSRAFSTLKDVQEPVKRIGRTVLGPFAETKHPYYSYGEPQYVANGQDGSLERYHRHGARRLSLAASCACWPTACGPDHQVCKRT